MTERRVLYAGAVNFYGQIAPSLNLPDRARELTVKVEGHKITFFVLPLVGEVITRYMEHNEEFGRQLLKAIGLEGKTALEIVIRVSTGVVTVETKRIGEMSIEEDVDWSLLKLMPDSDPIYHSDRPLEQNALDKLRSMRLGQDWPDATGTLDSAH